MMINANYRRILKFLMGGAIAAAFNLILISLFIEKLGFSTPILRNVANIVAIELSLIFSFFIYRVWVWPEEQISPATLLFKQLPLYHVSASLAIILRVFAIFPILDWLGISYGVNTLVGILLSASLNYIVSDRVVFRSRSSHQPELYPPETFAYEDQPRVYLGTEHYPPVSSDQNLCLSLVIPAYNEEGCIESTVNQLCETLNKAGISYNILVVNDNSRDQTETILQRISQDNPHVDYINNYYPNGFGFAVRCGLENFTGDAVAIVMADASDPPDCIVNYYWKLQEGYDCVFGSRFIRGGQVFDYPQYKLLINRLANLFVQIVFSLPYNDTTNAFKAYRRSVIEGVSPLISHHFNLTVEMPLKAIVRGYSVAVIPISWHNRKTGISKLKIKEMGSRYLFIVLSIYLEKVLSRGDYVQKNSFQIVYEPQLDARAIAQQGK